MCLDENCTPVLPIFTPEGTTLLQIKKQTEFNSTYADHLCLIERTWNEDTTATPLQSAIKLSDNTPAMTAYAASCVVCIHNLCHCILCNISIHFNFLSEHPLSCC